MARFELHEHEDRYSPRLPLLQRHVRTFHPGLEPPGVERDASYATLAAAHRREHESQEQDPAWPFTPEEVGELTKPAPRGQPAHDYVLHEHSHGGYGFEPLEWHGHPHESHGIWHDHVHRHVRPGTVRAPQVPPEQGR